MCTELCRTEHRLHLLAWYAKGAWLYSFPARPRHDVVCAVSNLGPRVKTSGLGLGLVSATSPPFNSSSMQ